VRSRSPAALGEGRGGGRKGKKRRRSLSSGVLLSCSLPEIRGGKGGERKTVSFQIVARASERFLWLFLCGAQGEKKKKKKKMTRLGPSWVPCRGRAYRKGKGESQCRGLRSRRIQGKPPPNHALNNDGAEKTSEKKGGRRGKEEKKVNTHRRL